MFIGHYALGFAARRPNPSPSLALLFIAVQLPDLLWPILVLAGAESFHIEEGSTKMTPLEFTHYPWSHSLLMVLVWGLLLGLAYFIGSKDRKGALILALLVLSHWVLDFLTHKPDLPLSPFSSAKFGLGLWNYPAITMAVEIALFLFSVFFYYRFFSPKRKGVFFGLVVFFLIVYFLNAFSPPPPSVNAVCWSAMGMWVFVGWAAWLEKK